MSRAMGLIEFQPLATEDDEEHGATTSDVDTDADTQGLLGNQPHRTIMIPSAARWALVRRPAAGLGLLMVVIVVLSKWASRGEVGMPSMAATEDAIGEAGCNCGCTSCGCSCGQTAEVKASCSSMTCPAGWTPRPAAPLGGGLVCAGITCDPAVDVKECCQEQANCASLTCSAGFVSKPDGASIHCEGAACIEDKDRLACCAPRANCDSFSCPEEYMIIQHAASALCLGASCDVRDDLMTCCKDIPTTVTPPPTNAPNAPCSSFKCPETMIPKLNSGASECAGPECCDIDVSTCCDAVESCVSFQCPESFIQKPGPGGRFCVGKKYCEKDDLDVCCEPAATTPAPVPACCAAMECPEGAVRKPDAEDLTCAGPVCGKGDFPTCCERAPEPIPPDCTTMQCPVEYKLKLNPEKFSCAGLACDLAVDKEICCEKITTTPPPATTTTIPDCSSFLCPEGFEAKPLAPPADIMCLYGTCDAGTCCIEMPKKQDILHCPLNCFGQGAQDVALPGTMNGITIEACREACYSTEGCEGILFNSKSGSCIGKKVIHTAKCQPGGEWITEILSTLPWGKCALMGDPHIVQFDRPYNPPVNNYNAGDFELIKSEAVHVQARFGFTTRFPEATSMNGIAVAGTMLKGNSLVVYYSGPSGAKTGFKVFWSGQQILKDFNSEFTSPDGMLVAKFQDMDPNNYHRDARHTIGGTAGDLPSLLFDMASIHLKIYCLLSDDSMNAVIESKKIEGGQDGFCGNFNCNPTDDIPNLLRLRGVADPVPISQSLFKNAPGAPDAMVAQAHVPADLLAHCDPTLKAQGQEKCAILHKAERESCIIDICEAGNINVAALEVESGKVAEEVEDDAEAMTH